MVIFVTYMIICILIYITHMDRCTGYSLRMFIDISVNNNYIVTQTKGTAKCTLGTFTAYM